MLTTSVKAAHWIVGAVDDATDGTTANSHMVMIYYPENKDNNEIDIVGLGGKSNIDNRYKIDCDLLSPPCQVDDVISVEVINSGDGYTAGPVNVTVTGGGYDITPDITLTKATSSLKNLETKEIKEQEDVKEQETYPTTSPITGESIASKEVIQSAPTTTTTKETNNQTTESITPATDETEKELKEQELTPKPKEGGAKIVGAVIGFTKKKTFWAIAFVIIIIGIALIIYNLKLKSNLKRKNKI